MRNKKIIGLNTEFGSLKYEGFYEERFRASISLLDYDAVVIDVGCLVESYPEDDTFQNKPLLSDYCSHQIREDFSVIREQIIELLKLGRNIFLLMGKNENCYVYTGEKQYCGTGKNARTTKMVQEFDMYSFLPIGIKATHVSGTEWSICGNSPYRDFFKQTAELSQYESYFRIREQCTPLAKVKGTEKMVAAVVPYEQGKIICLPQPYYKEDYKKVEYWRNKGKVYLDSLFELNDRLSFTDEECNLPAWADDIYILDEKEELEKRDQIEKKIEELKAELENQKQLIEGIQRYKLLLTSTGAVLEEVTKQVLSELGFVILDAEKGRSDIIAKYNDVGVVAEIKGVTKSAAEKHAAQLEKWVSQYIEETESVPKPLLIVNGYCETPIANRTESVFPQQMLKYCEARGHALVTTTQLLCLYIDIQKNPDCKEEYINELLSCVGRYKRYQDYQEYLNMKDSEGENNA